MPEARARRTKHYFNELAAFPPPPDLSSDLPDVRFFHALPAEAQEHSLLFSNMYNGPPGHIFFVQVAAPTHRVSAVLIATSPPAFAEKSVPRHRRRFPLSFFGNHHRAHPRSPKTVMFTLRQLLAVPASARGAHEGCARGCAARHLQKAPTPSGEEPKM
jgi:hypothetical protein